MEQETIKRINQKEAQLTEEEKKQRDLYLQQLAKGEIQGPPVGYPSVDKPWFRYTDVEKMYSYTDKKTVYQELVDANKDHPDEIAIEYFGRKITFGQLFKSIDYTANALTAKGIKKGDYISICSTGTPEVVYLFYACSKIGAVPYFVPPYFSAKNIHDRLNECNAKYMFVLDKCYDMIKDALPNTSIQETIAIPFFNSASAILKFLKRAKKNKSLTYWYDFINNNYNKAEAPTVDYEEGMPLALINSSGSTGEAKSILLTNDSFQESIHSYDACNIVLDRQQKFYQLIPPWVSTGLSTSVHLPLSKGITIFMDPRFDKDIFVNNIIKHHINGTVATATMYDGFVEKKLRDNVDLSFFNNAFEGGEPLKKERKEGIEKVLSAHGSKAALKIGYGQCESGSGITTQTDDFYRSDESIGIPIPGVIIKIVDENFNELPYGEKGQIIAKTKCAMKEYFKNPEATSRYFYYDENGERWSCTGDLGSVDSEGMVYIYGRMSDFSMINGEKVYNFDIERIAMQNPDVISCASITSKDEYSNDVICLHLVLDTKNPSDYEKIMRDIQKSVYEQLGSLNAVPYRFKVRDTIPVSKTSKRDNQLMRSENDGFTDVIFNLQNTIKR
ncbi:MAG: acyl--CoA ligase [Bacilli bacterium]|nr:acyl--CoA ligase [Bacilli bacterium]